MANISYASIRIALAKELQTNNEWQLIDEVSDWAIYKNEKDDSYHVIKFTTTETKTDGYKFSFDGSQIEQNEIATKVFLSFFNPDSEQVTNEDCLKGERNSNCTFYLAITDSEKEKFDVCSFSANDEILKKLPKIKMCFSTSAKYFFRLKKDNTSDGYRIGVRPNPENYNDVLVGKINNSITLTKDKIEEANLGELYKVDYNRILDRSFIYFIEYGTTEDFDSIVSNKDSFSELKDHLISNQEILKNNKDIEKEMKKGKSDKSYQLIKRYKDIDKNSLKIYEFKKCYKKYFEEEIIEINDFKEIFFGQNERKCAYCGVPEDKLDHLHTVRAGRGNRLEYDRISSRDGVDKNEYTEANIVLSCYWCNNAKTDTFSAKEFKEIARGINRVWNQKLKEANSNETICFPENSDIWDKE